MLYAILAYHVEGEILSMTRQEDEALMTALSGVHEPLRANGHFGPCARLDQTRTARTLRGPGAGMVLDGPFAETKEQFLGFFVVEVETMDEAIAAARDLAEANPGTGAYEIRPLMIYSPDKRAG